jgi:hypothetical protein
MGRNNEDFRSQILYHGGPTMVAVGETIEPKNGAAHATPDLEKAKKFANGFFGTGSGTVHIVEPLENDDTLHTPAKKPNELRSRQGFKVVGHHKEGSK